MWADFRIAFRRARARARARVTAGVAGAKELLKVWCPPGSASAMRAVIQRVSSASVSVEGEIVGQIGRGLLVLVGKEAADSAADIDWLAAKIVGLRIFADAAGTMHRSVREIAGDILLVSQFTLFASTKKGTRPSWHRAAQPEVAIPLYEGLTRKLGELMGRPIQTGRFGAMMQVSLVNDGPVTLIIDTKVRE